MKIAAALAAMLVCSACGDDGLNSDFEGIYTLSSWTENLTDCSGEGPSVLESSSQTAFFLEAQSFFGFEALIFDDCADVPACAEAAAEDDFIISGLSFEDGSDESGWTGASYILNSAGDGPCDGLVFLSTLTGTTGASVRIETETRNVENVPREADGFCDGTAAIEQGREKPCSQLEVREGAFAQGF